MKRMTEKQDKSSPIRRGLEALGNIVSLL